MTRTTWILLIVILLCATALRVTSLDTVPPGLYHDEAFSGLDALGIVNGAGFPIFFEGNGGREPFFIYMHALSIALFGSSPWSLRIPAAFVGVLTLAVFFVLVRTITPGKRAVWVALIGTAGLATSYWHLNFSRMGWRTISLPLFACLAFYFFWRAWRTQKIRDHLLAGIFLGASLYTYLSARFLPFVLVLFWATEWLVSFRAAKRREISTRMLLTRYALIVVSALVIFAPLGFYFATHPSALFFRVSDVALAGGANDLLANAWRVAQMFFAHGDAEWRHGIAYRPVLDWFTGIPFALGLFGALWQWRRPEQRFTLIWFLLLLVPTILSQDAPDTQRAIGALPVMFVFVAWGWDEIASRWSPQRALALGALVTLIGSGVWSARDYFVVWTNHPRAYYDYQGELVELAKWIMTRDESVIVPFEAYAHPTIQFLIRSRYPIIRAWPFPDGDALTQKPTMIFIPASLSNGGFVLVHQHEVLWLFSMASFARPPDAQILRDRFGKPIGSFGTVDSSSLISAMHGSGYSVFQYLTRPVVFGNWTDLFLANYPREIIPGKPLALGLTWRTHTQIQSGLKMFAHLLDASGNPVGGVDTELFFEYPLALLPRNESLPARYDLKVNDDLPPGKYMLEVGLFAPAQNARLPVVVDGKRAEDDRVLIGPLKVKLNVPLSMTLRTGNARFGETMTLIGFDAAQKINRGDDLKLTLLWKSEKYIQRDYTLFVHVLDEANRIVAQTDTQPRGGTYPTSIWDASELIPDEIAVTIPSDAPRGKMKIEIGWYDATTGERLPTEKGDAIILGEVSVE